MAKNTLTIKYAFHKHCNGQFVSDVLECESESNDSGMIYEDAVERQAYSKETLSKSPLISDMSEFGSKSGDSNMPDTDGVERQVYCT